MVQKKQTEVLEYAAGERPHSVDRELGVIRRVKVLGLKSRNGPRYAPDALRRAAPLYEGSQVFLGHPERTRPDAERNPADMIGWLEGVKAEGDGLFANLHYAKAHPMAGVLAEVAERNPAALGLSHNAVVVESSRGDEVVYESISRVRSVDLVCRPATTRGIFESEEVQKMDETQGGPAPVPAAPSLKDMILAKVGELLDGEGDAASKAKAIASVVKELLKVEDKLEAPPSGDAEKAVGESVKPAAEKYEKALAVLESAGLTPTAARLRFLAPLAEIEMKALAETWKPAPGQPGTGHAKPRSGSVLESEQEKEKKTPAPTPYDDPKAAASKLRGL